MKILSEVCSLPTAPFAEQHVVQYVEEFIHSTQAKAVADEFGNLLIELRSAKARGPRWVFGAHMDHPGFIARKMIDSRTLEADFRGWVQTDYVRGAAGSIL